MLAKTTKPLRPTRRPAAITEWTSFTLAPGIAMPPPGIGFALLHPLDEVRLIHARVEVSVRAGDLAVIDRELPFEVHGAGSWTARLLDLGDRRLATRVSERHPMAAMTLDGSAEMAQMVKRAWAMGQEISRNNLGDDMIDARLIDLVVDLCGRLIAQRVDGRVSSHHAATLERARMLIARHLHEDDFGPAALAQQMRVSTRHLSSLFASVDTTTSQAILTARMAQARALLTEPANQHRQIASIALACGFADQGYFARCFRQEFGVTPRKFRDHHAPM